MSVGDLLEQLSQRGVQLWFEGNRLRFRGPRGAMTADQRDRLVERRDEVIAELRAQASMQSRTAPLSYGQRALWFVNLDEPASAAYNVAFVVRVSSVVDRGALRQALQALVDRHAILRTTYGIVDDQPKQRIAGTATAAFAIDEVGEINETELQARVAADYRRPFDLERGPMLRATLFTRQPEDHVLLLTAHHVAVDGWSLLILLDEFSKLYTEATGGPAAGLPKPESEYTDYVSWQRDMLSGADGERLAGFWRDRLSAPRSQIELPADRPRPIRKSVAGATFDFDLDRELSAQLRELAKAEGTTLYVVLVAAFKALLFRYTGTEDVVVGTPTFGRSKLEFTRILGHFVNPVPLRTEVTGDQPFRQLMATVHQTLLSALDAQEYPLPLMVERLQPVRDPSRFPLFETMFVLQRFEHFRELSELLVATASSTDVTFAGLTCRPYRLHQQEGQFDLGLGLVDQNDALSGAFKYNVQLFDRATIERLAARYQTMLKGIVADPAATVADLPLLTAADRQQLLSEWNAAETARDCSRTLHALLESSAQRTPDSVAIIAGQVSLSYRDLDARANQMAHLLVARGVKPGSLVAVCVDRTVDMPVAIAAVLKAGAAYVPLDPTHPSERLRFTLRDAGVVCTVTSSSFAALFDEGDAPLLLLDRIAAELASQPATPVGVGVSPDDLAYVIYTSGSTGRPKGVEVEHRHVVAFLDAMRREPGFHEHDTLLAVTTLSFDIAGLEFWLPLSVGGRVVIASRVDALDGQRLASMLESHHVTVMQATPATWRLMINAGWNGKPDLKILCGGEAMPRDLAVALVERVPEVWNMYGPTETTIWSTICRVQDASMPISIGRPIANTRVYVVEGSGRLAPIGIPGELCIGGAGVARGYRNRHELTAEKFTSLMLPDGRSERVYRTGDVARFRNDGQLEFIGRRDHQVKVRGYRIELEEIEAVLAQDPSVKECVVTVREDSPGDHRLVGYVVTKGQSDVDAEAVKATLRSKLPEYMIPGQLMALDALPLTPNGKLDRKSLPAPQPARRRAEDMTDPVMSPNQRRVADIWRDLLRVERVGLYDNFFDLGGHSLLLVQLQAGLKREFRAELPMVELFQRTTVAAQADRLANARPFSDAIKRAQARAARQLHG